MSDKYILNVKNNSTQTGNFTIYQETPDTNLPGINTLAWLSKPAHPTTLIEFEWDLQYCFVWSKTTDFRTGTILKTGQAWDANLTTKNRIEFDYADGAYTFKNESKGDYEGNLYIDQAIDVVPNDASVGIGMSGKGSCAFPSEPNLKIIVTPKPTYWLIFGDFEEGEILDIAQVSENALKLQYRGTKVMNVEFTGNNTWSILSD